jgi:hypothetical protein
MDAGRDDDSWHSSWTIPMPPVAPGTTGWPMTSWGQTGYRGPCCPRGQTHRYVTRIFALDTNLDLGRGGVKADALHAMSGHVLAEATLMGRYGR